MLAELDALRAKFKGDPYKALDLWPGCGRDAVEERFNDLVAQHHPDRYASHSMTDVSRVADEVFIALKRAYATLLNAETSNKPLKPRPQRTSASRIKVKRPSVSGETAVVGGQRPASGKKINPARIERALAVISERYGRLEQNHYAFLGVDEAADPAAVKKAYRTLVKHFHVDRFQNIDLGREGQMQLEAVFRRINEAGLVLTNPDKRADYDAELAGVVASEVSDIFEAEEAFRRGRQLLERGQFGPALEKLAVAAEVNPNDADTQAHFLYAKFLNEPVNDSGDRTPNAIRVFKDMGELAKAHPDELNPHLFYAKVLELMGDEDEARKQFKRVLRIHPKHHEAERGLRLMKERKEQREMTFFRKSSNVFKNALKKLR